jgi:hypothetical protein
VDTKRRITFEVTEEQYSKLKDHLEYGLMKKVFSALVDDTVEMLDEFGDVFIVAILTKRVSYRKRMEAKNEHEHLSGMQ